MTPSPSLVERLASSQPVLVLTGAGVSAESGLSTFRGPGGLWEGRDPIDLATPHAFARDPLTVWRFYAWRRQRALGASPNAAHVALAEFAKRRHGVRVVTQNVDGLHERAGTPGVLRLHGSLFTLRCTGEGTEREDLRAELGALPPRCECGAMLRPGVVWFGEPLDAATLREASALAAAAGVVLVIGTSGLVHPAAGLPELARDAGAYVVEVNPEPTPITRIAHERLAGSAGDHIPALLEGALASIAADRA